MKKLVALFLTLCMLCGMLPAVAEDVQTPVSVGGITLNVPAGSDFPADTGSASDFFAWIFGSISNDVLPGASMIIAALNYNQVDGWREQMETADMRSLSNLYMCNNLLNEVFVNELGSEFIPESTFSEFELHEEYGLTPDGGATLIGVWESVIVCAHYYDGNGLYIVLLCDSTDLLDAMMATVYDMLASLELQSDLQ